jgi:hypothetical protein
MFSFIHQGLKVGHMIIKYVFMSNLYTAFLAISYKVAENGTWIHNFHLYIYQHAITLKI